MATKRTRSSSSCSSSSSEITLKKGKHRSTGYDTAWGKSFPWLETVQRDTGLGLLCKLCKAHNPMSGIRHRTWIEEPCTQLRKDKIMDHQRSHIHLGSVEAERTRQASLRTGGINRAFDHQINLQRQSVIGALKAIYWLAKEECAHHTKYESLLQLAVSMGCTYLSELHIAGNAHYSSHRIIDEFVEVLSDCVAEDTMKIIKQYPFIGIMCDESTDIGVKSQLALFAQAIYKGKPTPFFLKIIEMTNARSETIEEKIVSYIDEADIGISRMMGFGSDGASNMIGRHSGVAARLKIRQPELLSVHCCAHRVALAASQAADEITYLKKFKKQVSSLYSYFHHSPLRTAGLEEVQHLLEDPVISLKRVADTRWLSHDIAISTIRRTLPSLITFLESQASDQGCPVGHGLAISVKSFNFVAAIYFLSDVLPQLTRLSLVFQTATVNLSLIEPQVSATIGAIKRFKSHPGIHYAQIDEALSNLGINATSEKRERFQANAANRYIDAIVTNLENRFPNTELGVLSAFTILQPLPQLSTEDASLGTYGNSKVEVLKNHFNKTIDNEAVCQEWLGFKEVIAKEFSEFNTTQVMEYLVQEEVSRLYPELSKLANIALVLPTCISTATCERGFSTMKRIKTDLRNRLSTRVLDCLMRISIDGPELGNFDFEKAATKWGAKRNRRIHV